MLPRRRNTQRSCVRRSGRSNPSSNISLLCAGAVATRWRSGTPLRLSYFGVITLAK
jgi:hypothetical protein